MKYSIYDKEGRPQKDAILTQEGEIAFWDETMGWSIAKNQESYHICINELKDNDLFYTGPEGTPVTIEQLKTVIQAP